MIPPTINVFMMHPPSGDDKKEKSLGDLIREMMKMSSEMQKNTKEIKSLPHAEHAGAG